MERVKNYRGINKKNHQRTKRFFYLKLLIMFISGSTLFLLMNENESPLKHIAMACMFIFGLTFILLIANFQNTFDAFIPIKNKDKFLKGNINLNNKIYYSTGSLFFISLGLVFFEIDNFSKTIGGTELFFIPALIGIIVSLGINIYLNFKLPTLYAESEKRTSMYLGLLMSFIVLFPTFACFVNHTFANKEITCKDFILNSKEDEELTHRKREIPRYWLNIRIDANTEERQQVKKELYHLIKDDKVVNLCTQKGFLGYTIIKEIKKSNVNF